MPLQNYLMEGEEILAQCGNFYASNKRLIRYQKRLFSEELDDIPYSHITSVGVAKKPRKGLIWAGLTILGLVLSSLATLGIMSALMKSISPLMGGSAGILGLPGGSLDLDVGRLIPLHVVGIGVSLAMVLVGIFVPTVFIQFRAPGLDKNAQARFRLRGVPRGPSLELLRIVRQQSLVKESELADVRPTENRGNQAPVQ